MKSKNMNISSPDLIKEELAIFEKYLMDKRNCYFQINSTFDKNDFLELFYEALYEKIKNCPRSNSLFAKS